MGAMQGVDVGTDERSGGGRDQYRLDLRLQYSADHHLRVLCAQHFLSVLNIIFFWLPIFKICIPIPEQE